MSTFPARIGHLTGGQIRSIALHEATEETGELLARYLTDDIDIALLVNTGDIQRLEPRSHIGTPLLAFVYAKIPGAAVDHPDNAWPPGAQCLYLHQQDTWWKRTANTDGTWPDTWTPINQEEKMQP
jgi:hypothetical protein